MPPWNGKNVYFMGFMATGKSSVGKAFARLLHRPFIDTDAVIEQRAGQEIRAIFAQQGEPVFRAMEKQIIQEIAGQRHAVIALGGGAVLDSENWRIITESGITICLTASEDLIYKRIFTKSSRPLLKHESPQELRQKITAKLAERQPYYRQAQYIFAGSEANTPKQFAQVIYHELLLT